MSEGRARRGQSHHDARDQATRAHERIARLDVKPSALLEQIEELKQELAEARREAADNRAGWQRSAADFANYRRRSEQEREASLGLANELLLAKLLNVVDDFDRALSTMPGELTHLGWIEGLWLVERKLRALLESEGVTPIEALGKPFDPREHEAVIHEETKSAPDGQVVGEVQRGYRIRERVLRPALVKVAKNTTALSPPRQTAHPDDGTDDDTSRHDSTPGGIH